MARRQFLALTGAGLLLGQAASRTAAAESRVAARPSPVGSIPGKRVFLAGFSHETNTFHPVATRGYSALIP